MSGTVVIGMAELVAVKAPTKITTIGLGSCVGICLFDKRAQVAGMAHAMLPDSKKILNHDNMAKFVDTSVATLIDDMVKLGAVKTRIGAKIAGGAQMFSFTNESSTMRIGDRNIESSLIVLRSHNIPILARDVGLNYGRTIIFDSLTGDLLVKSLTHGSKTI